MNPDGSCNLTDFKLFDISFNLYYDDGTKPLEIEPPKVSIKYNKGDAIN